MNTVVIKYNDDTKYSAEAIKIVNTYKTINDNLCVIHSTEHIYGTSYSTLEILCFNDITCDYKLYTFVLINGKYVFRNDLNAKDYMPYVCRENIKINIA